MKKPEHRKALSHVVGELQDVLYEHQEESEHVQTLLECVHTLMSIVQELGDPEQKIWVLE
jgi:hypothetical protein